MKGGAGHTGEWTPKAESEEARAFFQHRLALFAKMMVIVDGLFFICVLLTYSIYPAMIPEMRGPLHLIGGLGFFGLVVLWRVLIKNEKRTLGELLVLDVLLVVGIGVIFGIFCALSYDREVNQWSTFIWTAFMVFARVLYVPSTAKRTAILSSIAIGFQFMGGTSVAIWHSDKITAPGPVWSLGSFFYGAVAVFIATVGSQVIYGLRKQVEAAAQLGQYTLGEKLGEGGMGAVYIAHHALLRRATAIKLLPPEKTGADSMERFEREVQLTAELNHPNTVAIYDYGRSSEGLFYYAMEYLDGLDLDTLVSLEGPQAGSRVVHILIQASGALQEAHLRGLIHRDIKPANILLCELGGVPDVAKVVDFGLVKELADGSQTTGSLAAGTPAYIAPETVMDPDAVGAPSDIYGLGAVGYFLLTGGLLFDAQNAMEMCVHHVRTEPTPVAERSPGTLSQELQDVIMGCLEKKPADRPQSAGELRRLLMKAPEYRDWSESQANTWWKNLDRDKLRELRGQSQIATSSTKSMTIERWRVGTADTKSMSIDD